MAALTEDFLRVPVLTTTVLTHFAREPIGVRIAAGCEAPQG